MTRPGFASRMVLLAYPRSFRREYGAEIVQSMADLRRHRGLSRPRLVAHLATDVVRTAPRMRMETFMSMSRFKPFALAAVISVGLLAAVVGSPVFLLLIGAAVALLAIVARSGDRPIVSDSTQTARWYRWVAAGAVSFAVGFGILIIDGPELTSTGWTVWAASWAIGLVLIVFGLVLAASGLVRRNRVTV